MRERVCVQAPHHLPQSAPSTSSVGNTRTVLQTRTAAPPPKNKTNTDTYAHMHTNTTTLRLRTRQPLNAAGGYASTKNARRRRGRRSSTPTLRLASAVTPSPGCVSCAGEGVSEWVVGGWGRGDSTEGTRQLEAPPKHTTTNRRREAFDGPRAHVHTHARAQTHLERPMRVHICTPHLAGSTPGSWRSSTAGRRSTPAFPLRPATSLSFPSTAAPGRLWAWPTCTWGWAARPALAAGP